ncbi:hypothetical protein PGB90_007062 [Kerria lacca]
MIQFLMYFVTILILYAVWTTIRPSGFPPGPCFSPFFGNTFLIKKLNKQLGGQYKAFMKCSQDYKTDILGLKLGNSLYVIVSGSKLIKQVYTKDEFQGRPDNFFIRLRTMGTRRGITMTEGPVWHEQRNFVERIFRQLGFGRIKMENLIKQELANLVSVLGDRQDDISLSQKLSAATLNVLWNIVGGIQIFKKQDKIDELISLLKERDKAFDMSGGLLNQIPCLRFICPNFTNYNLIRSLNTKLYNFFQEVINEHKETLTSETRDFIDAYLHEKQNSRNDYFTDDQLIAVCLDLFIGGALSTAYTLDFAILATINHPHIQRKLHEEIKVHLGQQEMPSLADKSKLPYIEALLLESQRFQHVIPIAGPRRVLKNTKLGNYKIPKNTIILTNLRSIHYDKNHWKDPEIFKPERFLNEKGELKIDNELCTFGLGKRRCPGEAFAKSFLFLTFTTLFHTYKISFPKDKKPSLELPPAGIFLRSPPYTVKLEAR